jgi:H/ACA ribonucleoprotein complex subunit 2
MSGKKEKKEKRETKEKKKEKSLSKTSAAKSLVNVDLEATKNKKTLDIKDSQDVMTYEQKLPSVSIIAKPLASEKFNKKLLKVVKKAAKNRDVRRGVKEVIKMIRKQHYKRSPHGAFVIFAGNISPIDILTHMPVLCEESNLPYIFVPSKEDLGEAAQTKRPTSCLMILPKKDAPYLDLFNECLKEIQELVF